MNHHSHTAGKRQLVRTVCGLFQTSCRRFQCEADSAFARNMEARMIAEACYVSPMPRF